MKIVTVAEAQMMPTVETKYLVQGLLRIGGRRINLIAGQPEAGKSTLARWLAYRVGSGEPFYGRETTKGQVAFFSSEETPTDLAAMFKALGYDDQKHETIHIVTHDGGKSPLATVQEALKELKEARLVILECWDDWCRSADLLSNTAVREAAEDLDAALGEAADRVCVVALTHLKKNRCELKGNRILGASALRGRSDTIMYVDHPNDDDPRRLFSATVRHGVEIPPHYLTFDTDTGRVDLGQSVAAAKRESFVSSQREHEAAIVEFLGRNPGATREDCVRDIPGNINAKYAAFDHLAAKKLITGVGKGVRNDPRKYFIAQIDTEAVEELPNEPALVQ